MKNKKINAAIIGSGKIGSFFDNPKSKKILTHAHAYKKHPKFNLVGFVDINFNEAKKAAKIWGGKPYKNIKELFLNEKVDVVSVCVPDDSHFKCLDELKRYNFLGGIIEKPLTDNLNDSRKIINSSFHKNKIFLLNYSRRYVPEYKKIKENIERGVYGKIIGGQAYYGKGLLHNASHIIDLLLYFNLKFIKYDTIKKDQDFCRQDPTYSVVLEIKNNVKIFLNTIPYNKYKVFEIDLFFEKARIKILDDGYVIEEYLVKDDELFAGYKKLFISKKYNTQLHTSMYHVVNNLYRSIICGENVYCSIKDGFSAQKICWAIKNNKKLL